MNRSYVMTIGTLLCAALLSSETCCGMSQRQIIGVKVESFDGPKPSVCVFGSGEIEIEGPNALRLIPDRLLDDDDWILDLEYFSATQVNDITLTPGPDYNPTLALKLPPFRESQTFSPYRVRLRSIGLRSTGNVDGLRLNLSVEEGQRVQIQNVRLRHASLVDDYSTRGPGTKTANHSSLTRYIQRSFDCAVTDVSVGKAEVTIKGRVTGETANILLGEIAMETLVDARFPYRTLNSIEVRESGDFQIALPRTVEDGKYLRDRLTSRWQLCRQEGSSHVATSHARYARDVACRSPDIHPAQPNSKKGLGGWTLNNDPKLKNDIDDLGITSVTVNIPAMHLFASPKQQPGFTPFSWQGRTYYANEKRLRHFDRVFAEAARKGVMVSAILLVSNPTRTKNADAKLLGHPDAVRDGTYAMPNVSTTAGISYYGAILNLMAERWSHNDGARGRVHHWIVHNEVDFGWVWTNAGKKTDLEYMDLYQRSMRLVDLIVRQYDPHARAWITLTHNWANQTEGHGYGSKRMLDLLVQNCQIEGDFPWALAYHPYPQSLFNPRTWEDDQATFDFNTAKITPMNIEVLDAYMKLPTMRYRGEVRPVHLSENGFNSKDYSDRSLEEQAAGMALAWKKIERLSSIESWQYHNWVDNRREGGLRIGLRKFPDHPEDRLGAKPIWHVYKALGTPEEDVMANPYLETIGIKSWEDSFYTHPIR